MKPNRYFDNLTFEELYEQCETFSVQELEELIVDRWKSARQKVDNTLKELLFIRRMKINSTFKWTPETKARFLHLNDELMRCFEMLRHEAHLHLIALQKRVDENDTFLNDFYLEARVHVFIYTPDEEGKFWEPDDGIECVLIDSLTEFILNMHISEDEDEMDRNIYFDKDFNWNIEPLLEGAFDEHYISYAIHELHDHTCWSIPDILRINRLWAEVQVVHQHIKEV